MSGFNIITHKIPCQHIREYPRALANNQEDTLYLKVKQYIPLDNPDPQPGDVTIIGAHANAIPKELYEPLWADLLDESKQNGFRIRAIWIADLAHQGESGQVNQPLLGNDPSWSDHARDLLHLINLKREEMPRPIVGIGHSVGGAQLVDLAYIHPRLLTTLVLLDPVIQVRSSEVTPETTSNPAKSSTFRRDLWPSRTEAETSFRKSPFYLAWDPRVLPLWVEYGLREVTDRSTNEPQSIATVSSRTNGEVTLMTPPAQEAFLFIRPNYSGFGHEGKPVDRSTHADVDPRSPINYPFYRSEPARIFHALPSLRPSALYVLAENSYVSAVDDAFDNLKVSKTGTGVGGSGGFREGRVNGVKLDGLGHMFPLEAPRRTAREAAAWIGDEIKRWKSEEAEHERSWKSKTLIEKQTIDERWKREIGGPPSKSKQLKQSGQPNI
jgi:pimeloyl-ACP methyl ester carboxylesterase